MSYDEQEARRSRVVVETPNTRREVTQTEAVRGDRDGVSGATVGVIVVVAIALVTILILFLMSGRTDTANENLALQQQPPPPTTIVQQPAAQQPPVIIQQAPAAPQQAPIIVTQPAPTGGTSGSNDSAIQSEVDKRIMDDPNLSTLGVTVSVLDGKATLMGTVKSETLKAEFERLVRSVRGVKAIDNQIIVG